MSSEGKHLEEFEQNDENKMMSSNNSKTLDNNEGKSQRQSAIPGTFKWSKQRESRIVSNLRSIKHSIFGNRNQYSNSDKVNTNSSTSHNNTNNNNNTKNNIFNVVD